MEKNETLRDHFARIVPLNIEVRTGMCEVDSDCTLASLSQKRLFMMELTINSAKKLVVEPPATDGIWSLLSCYS